MASKILLIESDKVLQAAIQVVLQEQGFEVVTSEDGVAAMSFVTRENFDLVISELNIKGGVDVLEFLRQVKRKRRMPIILMSGELTSSTVNLARQIGIEGFLPKPFNSEELLRAVSKRGLLPRN